jgi:hypothetical protein
MMSAKVMAPRVMREPAVTLGPKTGAAIRVNKKVAPHNADNPDNWTNDFVFTPAL